MAARDIVKLPDPVLKRVSAPVARVDDDTRTLVDDMFKTMYAAPGIGLAAVQVGVLLRIVVTDAARGDEPDDPMCLINPEIVWSSPEIVEGEEGCLSIPDVFDVVARPAQIKVRYLDRDGVPGERHCDGLLATCIQHEIDHLNGVLFIDHLSRLKRERIVRKFTKRARTDT